MLLTQSLTLAQCLAKSRSRKYFKNLERGRTRVMHEKSQRREGGHPALMFYSPGDLIHSALYYAGLERQTLTIVVPRMDFISNGLRGQKAPVRFFSFHSANAFAYFAIIVMGRSPTRTVCSGSLVTPNCMLKDRKSNSEGFSLIELLVAIAIIGILSSLSWTVLTSVGTSGNVALTCANISQLLDLARGKAMANATYVFVGFEEVDNSPSSAPATATKGGKIVVLVVASENGTNNYLSGTWQTTGNFLALGKPTYFPNVHFADFSTLTATSGPMASRVSPIAVGDSLGNSATSSSTGLFYWPLSATSASAAQYIFSKVIQFDPHGVGSVQLGNNSTPNPGWIEIGLQALHGDSIPPAPTELTTGQVASIQIDGITGVNQIFRP